MTSPHPFPLSNESIVREWGLDEICPFSGIPGLLASSTCCVFQDVRPELFAVRFSLLPLHGVHSLQRVQTDHESEELSPHGLCRAWLVGLMEEFLQRRVGHAHEVLETARG